MNIEEVSNPGYEQPQQPVTKSRKGWFACGGIGCLVLFLICGGAIGGIAYISVGVFQVFEEAKSMVAENQSVKDALGEPIRFEPQFSDYSTSSGGQVVELEWPLEGADGEAVAVIEMKAASITQFEIVGLKVKINDTDQEIDVLESSDIEVDIEDVGMDEELEESSE